MSGGGGSSSEDSAGCSAIRKSYFSAEEKFKRAFKVPRDGRNSGGISDRLREQAGVQDVIGGTGAINSPKDQTFAKERRLTATRVARIERRCSVYVHVPTRYRFPACSRESDYGIKHVFEFYEHNRSIFSILRLRRET